MNTNLLPRIALFLLLCVFLSNASQSQIVVQIGQGNSYNSNTDYPAPYGNWYWGAKHQFLIPASEIVSSGGMPGMIMGLAFNVYQAQGTNLQGFTIKIGSTSLNSLSSSFVSGLTTVYSATGYTETNGWNFHAFDTPFMWNGSDNLIVETCFNNSGYTYNAQTFFTNTTYNSTVYYNNDASGVCNTSSGATANMRPNIRLSLMPLASFSNDLALAGFVGPQSGVGLSSSEQVQLRVINPGTQTQTSFTLGYSVNGGSWITQQFTNTINPGDTLILGFMQTANLSAAGEYLIKGFVQLLNDSAWWNDSAMVYVRNNFLITQAPFYYRFSSFPDEKVLYEKGANIEDYFYETRGINDSRILIISGNQDDEGGGNLSLPGQGVSGNEAQITFYFDKTGMTNPTFRMRYRQEYAYDNYESKMRIFINDTNVSTPQIGYYMPEQYGWTPWKGLLFNLSGYSGNIVKITIQAVVESVYYSEDRNSLWIDEVVMYDKAATDVSVVDWLSPGGSVQLGQHPVTIAIANFGTQPKWGFPAVYSLDQGQSMITATVTDTVNPGDTVLFTFPVNHSFSTMGTYYGGALVNHPADTDRMNDTLYAVEIFAASPLSGVYTLGHDSADFKSFKQLEDVLKQYGLAGPTTINVLDGHYFEQMYLDGVSGLDTNSLLIQSQSLDPSKVMIEYHFPNWDNRSIITLENVSNITFNALSFKINQEECNALNFDYQVSKVTVNNCHFFTSNGYDATSVNVGSSTSGIWIQNCQFDGGDRNIRMNGCNNAIIRYNQFNEFNAYCIEMAYSGKTTIVGNSFFSTQYDKDKVAINISFPGGNDTITIRNNRIYSKYRSVHGVYIYTPYSDTTLITYILNNVIYLHKGDGNGSAIYTSGLQKLTIVHNSLRVEEAGMALHLNNSTANMRNNSITSIEGGFLYNVSSGNLASNYNHFNFQPPQSNPNAKPFMIMGAAYNHSEMISLGREVNSINGNPVYQNLQQLKTNSPLLDNKGFFMGLAIDIDGNPRSNTTPDIGAYEFTSLSTDLAIVELSSPWHIFPVGQQAPVTIKIFNAGSQPQSNFAVRYGLVGGNTHSQTFSGTIQSLDTVSFTFTQLYTQAYSGVNEFRVYVDHTGDMDRTNDTIMLPLVSCNGPMSGTYTAGGASSDFKKIQHAALALSACGVNGNVTINIVPGTYDEVLAFNPIPGSDTSATVTLTSSTLNNSDVIIQPSQTLYEQPIIFNNASHIRFKNISLTNNSPGPAACFYLETCTNVVFENLILNYTHSNNHQSYGIGNENFISNVSIIACQFNNFSEPIGISAKEQQNSSNITIAGNTINNFLKGIDVKNTKGLTIFGNELNSSIAEIGILLENVWGTPVIQRNKLAISGPSQDIVGIAAAEFTGSLNSASTTPTGHFAEVNNNFVSVMQKQGQAAYGVYFVASSYVNNFYNSINIYGPGTATSTAMFGLGLINTHNFKVLNSNIANQAQGRALFYFNNNALQSNYNNLYTNGMVLAEIMISESSPQYANNLMMLQSMTNSNQNSVSVPPGYYSDTDLHVLNAALNAAGTHLPAYPTDIDGDPRGNPPDIGADEFELIYPIDIALSDLRLLHNCPGMNELLVTVTNAGTQNITSFLVVWNDNYGDTTSWSGLLLPDSSITFTVSQGGDPSHFVPLNVPFGIDAKGILPNGVADMNPQNNAVSTQEIIYSVPIAKINAPFVVCHESDTLQIMLNPSGGILSGPGISGYNFTSTVAGVGTHQLVYAYTEPSTQCTGYDTFNIMVAANPSPVISGLDTLYCIDHSPVTLTANPSSGTFRINGLVSYSLYPSIVGAGTHNINYQYYDSNNCVGYAQQSFRIAALPLVSVAPLGDFCVNSDLVGMSIGWPTGGTYSGTAVVSNTFNPAVAGPGVFPITYTYTNADGCSSSATTNATVRPLPGVTFFGLPASICVNAPIATLTGYPAGGTFTGVGIAGNTFNPAAAAPGTHTIVYSYTDGYSCTNSDTQYVQVHSLPLVTFNNPPVQCENGAPINLTASPSGGTFSGPGVNGGQFNPAFLTTGTYNLMYEYSDINNCKNTDTASITVSVLPTVSFTLQAQICSNEAPITLTASPSGGSFSGPGVTANTFNPALAGSGIKTLTYTYTDINNCTASATQGIQVNSKPITGIAYSPMGEICLNAAPLSLNGIPTGGAFSGTGVSGSSFNPAIAGIGSHSISYIYSDANGCKDTSNVLLQVRELPNVVFNNPSSVCENSTAVTLSGATPAGGVYSGVAVFGGNFLPSIAGTGTHALIYTASNAFGCQNSDTAQITVSAVPTSTFTTNSPICFGDTLTITYTGTATSGANYNWNFDGGTVVSGSGQGPIKLNWPVAGIKQLSLTVTENACTSQATSSFVIVHTNDAFISAAGGTSFCQGDSLLLVANAGTGLNYQWYRNDTLLTGATQAMYYAKTTGNFKAKVSSTYGCSAWSNSIATTMFPIPVPTFSLPPMVCANDTISISYTGTATTLATYNWDLANAVITSGTGQGPLGAYWSTAGPKLITLQVSENGCTSALQSAQIMVNTTVATATAPGTTTVCNGETVTIFANSGSNLNYQWRKDGQDISGFTLPYYTANQSGSYTVRVTNTLTTCAAVSNAIPIVVNTTDFNLAFTASSTNLTATPFLVAFSNQTPNMSNYYYTWDFGDGNTSAFNEPFHQYGYDGTYSVTLFAQNIFTGCRDTLKKTNYITCTGGTPNPCTITATINLGGSGVTCPGDSLLMTANVSGAKGSVTYKWFRDGVLMTQQTTASFQAKLAGLYRVIVEDTVCSFTSSAYILAHYPVVVPQIFSNDSIRPCSNDSMQLQVATVYNSYQWSTGATTPTIYTSQSGNYFVTATDANNCKQVSLPFEVNASLLQAPAICIVGVDSNSRNTIVWERPITNQIDSFYVWRETTVANVYQRIGGMAYNDFSAFTDVNANPAQRAWRYRLTAIDTCGQESPMSSIHKTMHLTINKGLPGTWNLIWDHYLGFNFGSYAIYRGSDSTNLSLLTMIQSNLNSYTDLNPPTDTVFYQIEIVNPFGCNPTKAMNYNTSRSNQANTMALINIDTTGIQSIKGVNFDMNVFPNPNNGNFVLSLNSRKAGSMEAVLLNALGQAVYSERFDISGRMQRELSLEHLPTGVYFLRVSNEEGSRVMKVVVR